LSPPIEPLTDPKQILKEYWGYDAFRPMQEDIIRSVLNGKDVLALMPTGGGKSLCYQVPAMAMDGLCLVISPLIALMKDQVENLRKRGITAFAIFSGMSRKEVIHTFHTAIESNCKFLYVSPERLETHLFKEYLPGLGIQLIAVDEAHCVSQWGYDFRPPYLRIAAIRTDLPDVPILALTASATPEVQEDIAVRLELDHPQIYRQSFERANLSYSCFRVESKINKITDILKKVPGTGIVYCKSRKRTKEIAELLQLQGIPADYYHAGLNQEERAAKQEAWIKNKVRVIVCTNAFGMGIDKPDVRVVVHADVPDCLENYYQEAGRAGRDGKTSYAVLLYDEGDLRELEEMAALRFPSLEEIREVYQAIANYLQLPTGSGAGQYLDFDIADFLKKFRFAPHTLMNAMRSLEQEDWLSFNEQVFMPSTVLFTINKEGLYAFEAANPELEPCIKSLLRAYEGIYDIPVAISEIVLAGLMYKDAAVVKNELLMLDKAGVIRYQPRKDNPQVCFLRDRIKATDISIDLVAYEKRKEQFRRRMKQMISFVQEERQCRSRIIGTYFGDTKMKDCGICDNCLKQKATVLSKEEFAAIEARLIQLLDKGPVDNKVLLEQLTGIKKEKAWKVLNFLQAENKIGVDATGKVWLK
jgi:ATP-dependent DNA helicase RecQ